MRPAFESLSLARGYLTYHRHVSPCHKVVCLQSQAGSVHDAHHQNTVAMVIRSHFLRTIIIALMARPAECQKHKAGSATHPAFLRTIVLRHQTFNQTFKIPFPCTLHQLVCHSPKPRPTMQYSIIHHLSTQLQTQTRQNLISVLKFLASCGHCHLAETIRQPTLLLLISWLPVSLPQAGEVHQLP